MNIYFFHIRQTHSRITNRCTFRHSSLIHLNLYYYRKFTPRPISKDIDDTVNWLKSPFKSEKLFETPLKTVLFLLSRRAEGNFKAFKDIYQKPNRPPVCVMKTFVLMLSQQWADTDLCRVGWTPKFFHGIVKNLFKEVGNISQNEEKLKLLEG